jgi:hypothetical protein
MVSTELKSTNSRAAANGISKAEPRMRGKTVIEDLEFAIEMLRIRMGSTSNLSEKIRYYNQIRTLQDNIARLKAKVSSQRSESDCAKA